jgi:hypothetical protein
MPESNKPFINEDGQIVLPERPQELISCHLSFMCHVPPGNSVRGYFSADDGWVIGMPRRPLQPYDVVCSKSVQDRVVSIKKRIFRGPSTPKTMFEFRQESGYRPLDPVSPEAMIEIILTQGVLHPENILRDMDSLSVACISCGALIGESHQPGCKELK